MSATSHQRQILFFVAAVLLPCVVLIVLSVRITRQERELSEKRVADERKRIAAQIREDLLARLERIKSEEASAVSVGGKRGRGGHLVNPAVALVARIEEGQLILPWESPTPGEKVGPLLGQPQFAAKLRLGEEQEFVKRDYAKAAALYGEAAQAANHPVQLAHAQLQQARAQARSGQQNRAATLYRKVLAMGPEVTDEQGIPTGLYAAVGLLDLDADYKTVLERIRRLSDGSPDYTPAQAYLTRDLLEKLARSAPKAVAAAARQELKKVLVRIRFLEQALALQRDFASLGLAKAPANWAGDNEPTWVPYAEKSWLVSVAPAAGNSPPLIIAVRAGDVLPAVEKAAAEANERLGQPDITAGWALEGESLGPSFPGMQVAFTAIPGSGLTQELSIQGWFYLITLGLVLSVTLFAAYLLWRDVQRELRLAELRSQFVSSVSHELKTPLTAIRMFAETLSLGRVRDTGAQTEYLDTIVSESQRLTRLLNNVLDFSKIEQGKKIYRLEPASLAEVVRAAARTMQYPLAQQGFQLHVETEEGLPEVRADADALEQAILNLLTNAMKFSGASREIELKLRRQDCHALIEVCDHGIGIAPGEQARIFEKFYRVPDPRTQRVPGTGLGLTLVQHIARAHGGEVKIVSELGKGSTFTIRIPLEENT